MIWTLISFLTNAADTNCQVLKTCLSDPIASQVIANQLKKLIAEGKVSIHVQHRDGRTKVHSEKPPKRQKKFIQFTGITLSSATTFERLHSNYRGYAPKNLFYPELPCIELTIQKNDQLYFHYYPLEQVIVASKTDPTTWFTPTTECIPQTNQQTSDEQDSQNS